MKNVKIISGLVLILTVLCCSVFANLLTTESSTSISLPLRFEKPSFSNPFGRDQDGGDVFAKVLYGARISLFVAFTVVTINALTGLVLGTLAGYLRGSIDLFIMRLLDVLYSFPGFLLAITLVAIVGPSLHNLILVLCLTGWATYTRLIRGEFLHLISREYVQSAIALGASPLRVVVISIWPNLLSPLLVQCSFGLASTILAESSLSFLGLGVPPTTPTWGSLLNSGRKYIVEAPHLSFFPGVCIVLVVLGFNLLGDGFRAHFNPRKSSI